MTMLNTMIRLAAEYHDGQYDLAGQSYILHPLTVMQYLETQDDELRCIAIGHDLIEDTEVTVEELYMAGMTKRVVEGILALTKLPGEPYHKYQAKVLANLDAVRVKLCDIRHNLSPDRARPDPTAKDLERIEKYKAFQALLTYKLQESLAW